MLQHLYLLLLSLVIKLLHGGDNMKKPKVSSTYRLSEKTRQQIKYIAEAEKIILSVVKRELNMITAMGGVLGFVIGLLPGVMQLL